jgi:hypothetical protein
MVQEGVTVVQPWDVPDRYYKSKLCPEQRRQVLAIDRLCKAGHVSRSGFAPELALPVIKPNQRLHRCHIGDIDAEQLVDY